MFEGVHVRVSRRHFGRIEKIRWSMNGVAPWLVGEGETCYYAPWSELVEKDTPRMRGSKGNE